MAQDSNSEKGVASLIDPILPGDMAKRAEMAGAEKAGQDWLRLLALSALAGAYIAFGATFAAAVSSGFHGDMPVGLGKMLGGLAFSLAYVLAIIGGAELFTTNNLMVMAWAHGRLKTHSLLRAWGIVFAGNFIGAAATGAMLIIAGQHGESGGAVGASLIASATRINELTMVEALFLGTLGNTLLCLGVWLTYSGRTTTDRILALIPPVAAFYAMGLEHAVAVMFYLPTAAFIGLFAGQDFWAAVPVEPLAVSLTGFLRVLLPVTLGNIIGGGVLVALMYWFVYLRPGRV